MFELDNQVIAAQPDYDGRRVRGEFREFVGHLRTIVVHCFDPRVTGGIPYAVAEALPGQDYPGDITKFIDGNGKEQYATTTTIFPVINAGGKYDMGAQRSVSTACHLFDIENVAIVHHTDCGATHSDPETMFTMFKEDFDRDLNEVFKPNDIGWIRSFEDSLKLDVDLCRNSPATPAHVNVYGFCYDIETGNLHLLEERKGDPNAPRGKAWREPQRIQG